MVQKTNLLIFKRCFLSHNSFYVFASQIATASQPVISLFANAPHPEKRYSPKEKDLFFVVLYTSLRSSKCKACGSKVASLIVYWGNLPMPQTPLDAHFL